MMNKVAALLLTLTAACATENDGALNITGRLADPSQVTHVIATNPSTGDRIVVDMKSDGEVDGRFNVALPAGGSWIVTFVDSSKTGSAMRIATLQTGGLDAFSSKTGGSLDFGTVSFSGTYAHGSLSWNELETAFGVDEAALTRMAKLDNLALRYSNPDVDGDGKIDALQDRSYRLELAGTYRMQQDGRDLTMSDLVTGLDAPTVRYVGTAIEATVPRSMDMNMRTGTVQFDQPFYGTANGPSTQMVESGTQIGQPHVKFGEIEGNKQVGVVAAARHNAPSGTYQFGFDNGKLTFSDVYAPTSSGLMAATDYAVPFVRIRTANPSCVINCEIGSIELEWKTLTTAGWQLTAEPTDARLDIVANFNGKRTNLAAALTDGATSLTWSDMPTANTGLLRNELSYISTAEICYFAVSYTSENGMKMTSQVENTGCF